MQYQYFAVGDEPYCLLEDDIAERTKAFLEGFDADFFKYLLEMHMSAADEQRASAGIRIALHHAIETMFSLLGAFVQAPQCAYAWIARCRTEELREVVRRIDSCDESLITYWGLPKLGWEELAKAIFSTFQPGTDEQRFAVEGFARTWQGMAALLHNEANMDEYNAAKHGFRMTLGGFKVEISTHPVSGQAPEEREMLSLGGSKFGAMFLKVDKLDGKGGRYLQSRQTAVNWSPERDILLLQLAQFSIHNIITALKVVNRVAPEACTFVMPVEEDSFRKPWKHVTGAVTMTFDRKLSTAQMPELKRFEILEKLRSVKNAKK